MAVSRLHPLQPHQCRDEHEQRCPGAINVYVPSHGNERPPLWKQL